MKKAVFIFTAFISTVVLFSSTLSIKPPKPKAPLAIYGQYIYEREKCASCHTFFINEATEKLISLDGYGQTHSTGFTYTYLHDPKSVISKSIKKPLKHLLKKEIKKQRFKGLLNSTEAKKLDENWAYIGSEGVKLAASLTDYGYNESNNNELLALIAYLHYWPPSLAKQKQDSLIQVEKDRKLASYTNEDGLLIKTARAATAESIEKGKNRFMVTCRACHPKGGGVSKELENAEFAKSKGYSELAILIAKGNPNRGMPAWSEIFKPTEIGEIIAYLKSFETD
ncbi:MAG: c-type cytochrome [Bacteroidia bacterium]